MRYRSLFLLLLSSTLLCGCEKPHFDKALFATNNTDSYKENINKKKPVIEGNTTLSQGDYVVYSYDGTNCIIQGEGKREKFCEREYVHVEEDIQVTISDGYILPLEDASALNGEIEKSGVFLVGFDILPDDKMATDDVVEVTEEIPTLFVQPTSISYQKWDRTTFEDGMCVRLDNAYAVTKKKWNPDEAMNEWFTAWEDTSIDFKRGLTGTTPTEEEEPTTEEDTESKSTDLPTYELPIKTDYMYLLCDNDHERIDMWEDRNKTLYRAYYHRIWFKCSQDQMFTTTAKEMWELPPLEYDAEGKKKERKLEKCKYNPTAYKKVSLSNKLNDMYLVGVDIEEGVYKVEGGKVKILSSVPDFKDYSSMVSTVDQLPSFTKDAELVLRDNTIIVCDDTKIKFVRKLEEGE